MKNIFLVDFKTIIATILGGLGLLFATVFFSSFMSSPPTRAEYNAHVATFESTQKSIDSKLTKIEADQNTILVFLLESKKGK